MKTFQKRKTNKVVKARTNFTKNDQLNFFKTFFAHESEFATKVAFLIYKIINKIKVIIKVRYLKIF